MSDPQSSVQELSGAQGPHDGQRPPVEDPELETIKRTLRQAEEEVARLNEMQAQADRELSSTGINRKCSSRYLSISPWSPMEH